MTWEEYYSKFYGWATSTQIKRLPYAMLNADMNPAEIVDVARDILDGKAAGRLMKRAADAGSNSLLSKFWNFPNVKPWNFPNVKPMKGCI